ncbi:MAG: hypothetical protein M1814_003610 [Vezdaea aestivalis]|nr:MAG: hypothetical protein M1814_003610 [Vezdaea aestivalis]
MASISGTPKGSPFRRPPVPIPERGVDYRGKIVLAPMVRSGELPTRLLALKYGADLVWGPETIDRALIGCIVGYNSHSETLDFMRFPSHGPKGDPGMLKPSIIYKIRPSESSRHIYQMGTASPALAVEAGKLIAPHVAGIDVNAGCPKPFSTTGGMGAALLRNPDNLCAILSALVTEVGRKRNIGISVKIRILQPPEDTISLVERLCKTGITGLTIHCRTPSMRPGEQAVREQLRNLADICRNHGVAVLMNGDVTSRRAAQDLITEFGVDGAMIATAAEKNASCFLPDGAKPWREVTEEYLRIAVDTNNKWGNTKFMLGNIVATKSPLKEAAMRAKSYEEVVRMFELEDLLPKAKELDLRLGLTQTVENDKGKQAAVPPSKKHKRQASGLPAEGRRIAKSSRVDWTTAPKLAT